MEREKGRRVISREGNGWTKGARIVIVGCGEIGSRHLQAAASLPFVREIEVVDLRSEALRLGQQRLLELPERNLSIEFRWFSSLEEATKGSDLCIIATQAQGRCRLVRRVNEILGCRSFLLEKLVAQSVEDMEELFKFVTGQGLSAWVNCKTRAYPFHQRLKRLLDSGDPILFSVVGGNHGLANNGIHAADLFAFYDGTDRMESAGSRIDPILHPSKRGEGLFDLSGTLQGFTSKRSHFTLSYASDHDHSEQITIATHRYRCIVDHMQRWAVESDSSTGWSWRPVPFEGNLMVSWMTKGFVSDILLQGTCQLPTLGESLVAHRFILGELRPHFNRLLEQEAQLCPIA